MPRATGKEGAAGKPLDALRNRGFRGGKIAPHRAMIGLPISWSLAIDMVVIPSIFSVIVFLLMDPLMGVWRTMLEGMQTPMQLPGTVGTTFYDLGWYRVAVPTYTAVAEWPSGPQLAIGWVVNLLYLVIGLFLKGSMLPVGYLFRFLAAIQCTAQLWFTFADPPFTYGLPEYTSGLLVSGTVILMLASFLVGFTFNIFDFSIWKKLLLTTLLIGHLAILFPLQAAVHAYIIHRGTLLAMPVLYLVFGILTDVFVYVALYGWGMSWRSAGTLDPFIRKPPVNPPRYPAGRTRPTPTPQSVRAITPTMVPIVRQVGFRMDDES